MNETPWFQANGVTHLTFDCYGTLIDWRSGILAVLEPLLQSHGLAVAPEAILGHYAAEEARLQSEPWRPYREILTRTAAAIGSRLGIILSEQECRRLPDSLGNWQPFPDTVEALSQLRRQFKLVILSNIDDALFARTAARLEVRFDEVITAEQVRSYKPGEAHFVEALKRLQVPPARILHVAQSLYHDHVPAKRMGWRTAWVHRTVALPDLGEELPVRPDLQIADLASLVGLLQTECRGQH